MSILFLKIFLKISRPGASRVGGLIHFLNKKNAPICEGRLIPHDSEHHQ